MSDLDAIVQLALCCFLCRDCIEVDMRREYQNEEKEHENEQYKKLDEKIVEKVKK